ncbi:MAG: aminotransferase class V-fold PLP-dependent enzyme [Deltaproteobacteria bacterium]|nr:aminotransferase class V-fold PLP-dependent enzyme [Deltaproteobacteria bacterium]MCX7953357.1 aminotransferase class V-fold PLP-dependent enzyme [Deltaproteobacteria bacterium]
MRKVYLDANSNYGLLPSVREAIKDCPDLGNPNSLHFYGQTLKALIEETRETVRKFFRLPVEYNIYFCSGATEAANWLSYSMSKSGKKVLTSKVEHACVIESLRLWIERCNLIEIPVNYSCDSLFEDFKNRLPVNIQEFGFLVWMHSHNETGVIFPLKEYTDAIKKANPSIRLVCDAVQSICKVENFQPDLFDAFFISGHKIGALPGVGVLVTKPDFPLFPMIVGGSQEKYMRAGTESYQAIFSLKKALEFWQNCNGYEVIFKSKKEYLKNALINRLGEKAIFYFEKFSTVPNTLHVSFPGHKSSDLLVALDLKGICCSAGSSCYSGKPLPPSLEGFLMPPEISKTVLRLSFRLDISQDDLEYAAEKISEVVNY